ncbi:MAG: class III aminotransferase [SAR86 cluster bacterium]|uniref:Class III aminotransferase n=1 Tax=SAR86 cluster bacterium TaxID=2030880 RepID=A0A2A5B5S2_9GAMM|nr:MAG: class III aminotransferase [SAR86 cluster bacterium]
MIAVAPNGARKTEQDHPRIPLNSKELAVCAAACLEAGACMIHLHVRDANNAHTLNADRYIEATKAIRDAAGDELIIQITTEAVGIYNVEQQIQAVKDVKPEAVSLSIREFMPVGSDEKQSADFFKWLYTERVSPQYILYSQEDICHFNDLHARGIIPDDNPEVLLVLGRYSENQQSKPDDLSPLLKPVNTSCNWWLCAFGTTEAECMQKAITLGGHCRVGFENNLLLPDGNLLPDNESSVSLIVDIARKAGRSPASPTEARQLMKMR